jgi:hypothetical protein
VRRPTVAALVTAALACASPRATAPPVSPPPPPSDAPAPPPPEAPPPAPRAGRAQRDVVRGMEAAAVRAVLGEPRHIERIDSTAAHGSRYERWIYDQREVVLLDGKVIDLLP